MFLMGPAAYEGMPSFPQQQFLPRPAFCLFPPMMLLQHTPPVPSCHHHFHPPPQLHDDYIPDKVVRMIGWIRPPQGWFKVNTDGAWKQSSGFATAAGVIRNSDGLWCGGFVTKLEDCSTAYLAELWGILEGLQLAWDMGYKNIILESDNKIAVDTINVGLEIKGGEESEESVLAAINEMLNKDWNVVLEHQYREGNRVADELANFALNVSLGELVILDYPPEKAFRLLMEDIRGVKFPRLCNY